MKLITGVTILVVVAALSTFAQQRSAETKGMALIPGATFEMGIDQSEIPAIQEKFGVRRADLFEEEVPKHNVKLESFLLDRTEVTNAQFRKFLETNREWRKENVPAAQQNGKYLQHWNGNDFPAGRSDHPVAFVTWHAAVAYCHAQGKRLPTEAEWEYAARGGLIRKTFPWGDEMPDKTRANYGASGISSTTTVGSYPPNGYGLYDMPGNVWEFLSGEWRKYGSQPDEDANALLKDKAYLKVTTRRALRGGSFGGGPVNLRVTYRDSHQPQNAVEHVGFRCAKSVSVAGRARQKPDR